MYFLYSWTSNNSSKVEFMNFILSVDSIYFFLIHSPYEVPQGLREQA